MHITESREIGCARKLAQGYIQGEAVAQSDLLFPAIDWITQTTEEKCIVVSHFTSTLNIIEAFLKKKSYTYHRLDG